MTTMSHAHSAPHLAATHATGAFGRNLVIGLIAFLTVVDLFATQAILPSLARAYGVMPAAMGLAVNASTIGMAVAGLVVAFFSRRINRRTGIVVSLALLCPPDHAARDRAGPRHLHRPARGAGRVHGGGVHADPGLSGRALQCRRRRRRARRLRHRQRRQQPVRPPAVGGGRRPSRPRHQLLRLRPAQSGWRRAGLVLARAHAVDDGARARTPASPFATWGVHLRNAPLRRGFAIGFLILFAFIGTFTFVNFVLAREPLAVSPMALGFVYFVFLPAIFTTPFAGRVVARFGTRPTFWGALGVAGAGLPLLLTPSLPAVLARPGAGRGRHLLRAGHRHRLHRPRRHHRPRLGQRHLPRLLLPRRPGRHRSAGPGVRPARLGRLRRRRRLGAGAGGLARRRAEDGRARQGLVTGRRRL